MPFRRRARMLRKIEERSKTTLGASQFMALLELLIERVYSGVRLLLAISATLGIIVLALWIQVGSRNHLLDQFDKNISQANILAAQANNSSLASKQSSEEAARAAVEAKTALQAAIAATSDPAVQRRTQDALDSISRIEFAVCHGPCPPLPKIAPTTTTTTTTTTSGG